LLCYTDVTHIEFKRPNSDAGCRTGPSQAYEVLAANVAGKQGGSNLKEKHVRPKSTIITEDYTHT
jgi:hypothetical protein